jgi:hypothetical protein
MALKVYTAPGFVFVTCAGETVVVAGVLVAPPGDAEPKLPVLVGHGAPTSWFPSTGPDTPEQPPIVQEPVEVPPPPPPTGTGRGGVSTQLTKDISERFVSLALSGQFDLGAPEDGPLNRLLASKDFLDFHCNMPGPYALTVSPRSALTAPSTSVVVGGLAPSVLMKNWIPNG